ncbi:MAG: hypothetical protein NTX61_00060 [Bacteroidetes bacterium]|nr:hypothetical protein [Bacteroidota bacterium]
MNYELRYRFVKIVHHISQRKNLADFLKFYYYTYLYYTKMYNTFLSKSIGMNPRAEPWTQIPGQAPGNLPCTSSPAPLLLKQKGTGVEVKKLIGKK